MDKQIYARTTTGRTSKCENSSEFVVFRSPSRGAHACACPSILHREETISRDSAASQNFDETTLRIPHLLCYFFD